MDADTDTGAPAASKPKKSSKTQHVAAVRKNHLNIVFIGHVGKSLYLTVYLLFCVLTLESWYKGAVLLPQA